jgi:CRISPR-associated protein Cas1
MTAKTTLHQPAELRKSAEISISRQNDPAPIKSRHGVVTLFGYGISIRVERGQLVLTDGIGDERYQGRFPRVGHGIERIVTIGNDGNVSLAALRWLADQKAAFVMLERDGTVLLTTGPVRSSDARLRRAQAQAAESGIAVEIARSLIDNKLANQESLVRENFIGSSAADEIAEFRAGLQSVATIDAIRLLEAQGAFAYWSAWQNVPITFAQKDVPRVPEHWRAFDGRRSPLTGSPRLAVNPANAMLNYLYALLESEARLAAAAVGLDPGLGFLHTDTEYRDSLACDLMEPVRPQVDAFVLNWLNQEPLSRAWFFEERNGNCRLMADLAARLSETASTWRHAVAPLAEWTADTLWASIKSADRKQPRTTPLTQRRKREAKGAPPAVARPPRPQTVCRICGTPVPSKKNYCKACTANLARERMYEIAKAGRAEAQKAAARATPTFADFWIHIHNAPMVSRIGWVGVLLL